MMAESTGAAESPSVNGPSLGLKSKKSQNKLEYKLKRSEGEKKHEKKDKKNKDEICQSGSHESSYSELISQRTSKKQSMPVSRISKDQPAINFVKPSLGKTSGNGKELRTFSAKHTIDNKGHFVKHKSSQTELSLISDDVEVPLSQKDENSGIIVVLGTGGEVKDILMPEEFRTVFVDKPSETSTEDTVIAKFRRYGKIKDHRIFRNSQKRWGCVTFDSSGDAALAVKATRDDECEVALPERRGRVYHNSDFWAKITWCRRESKGFGFVDVSPKDLKRILKFGVINIEGHLVKLVMDRQNEKCLYLRNFGKDVTEEDIKIALLKLVGNVELERIAIIREKVDLNQENMENIHKELMEMIGESVPKERFRLDLKHPRNPGTLKYLAFVHFTNADEGIKACQRMSGRTCIQNRILTMKPHIRSSIEIRPEVYVAVHDDLDSYLKECQDFSEVEITSKNMENGNLVLNIDSSNTSELAKIRGKLQDILQDDILECGTNPHLLFLFCRSGCDFLKDVEKKCNVYIHADNRNLTISIQGKLVARTMARSVLNDFVASFVNSESKEVNLRGSVMPNGVMKTLMNEYGLELEKLQQKTGLRSLTLNFKQQMVKMIGSFEAIAKTVAAIDGVCASLQEGPKKTKEEDLPDCGICFCPIEDNDLFQLELCGHDYCCDCVKLQVKYHVKTKGIPISCVQQDCGKPFTRRDLTFLTRQEPLTMNSIVQSSVSSYVIANSKDIKYCLTPDCNMVYKVTTTGAVFRCPECNMKICTSCHIKNHEGLTCAMLRGAREDKFDVYLASNTNTKECPNCSTAIEKIGGCNDMFCEGCKCNFCWICLKRFKSSKACCAHLSAKHGSRF